MSVTNMNAKRTRLMGVWVDGTLRFQSRDDSKARAAAQVFMKEKNRGVWLAPVGSFYI